jgi:hypothetical protein
LDAVQYAPLAPAKENDSMSRLNKSDLFSYWWKEINCYVFNTLQYGRFLGGSMTGVFWKVPQKLCKPRLSDKIELIMEVFTWHKKEKRANSGS